MTAMIVGFLVAIFGMMTLAMIKLTITNAQLRTRLATTEEIAFGHDAKIAKQDEAIADLIVRTTPKALTQEQKEFKETLELKWKTAMEELTKTLTAAAKKDGAELKKLVESARGDFDKKVEKAFEDAVAKIDFDKVEYKKTITKKRKEFSRSHKATKAQKTFRSIDDE